MNLLPFIITLTLVLLYLLAISPNNQNEQRVAPFKKQLYSHRGFHDNHKGIPENSLAAFRNSLIRGYGIELDVQLTKDGQAVVFHDYTLKRMCKVSGNVWDYTYDELKEFPLLKSQETIPLLSEVLELVNGQVPLLIEIKLPGRSTKTCEAADKLLKDYSGSYCIESFNTCAVRWYRKNRPDIVRGQLSSNLTRSNSDAGIFLNFMVKYLLTNFYGKPDFIAYNFKDIHNISFALNKQLFDVTAFAWTVQNELDYLACAEYFDAIIFEGFSPEKNL